MKKLLPAFLLILSFLQAQGQIIVNPARDNTNPVSDSLVVPLAGFGISISNVQTNLRPNNRALASFRSLSPDFPIAKGLMMCTGAADTIAGQNSNQIISVQIPAQDTIDGLSEGRQMLNILLANRSTSTLVRATDVATIKFDLVPAADSLRFRYIFSSEEYPNFVCSNFNDVFGFFIQGPGIEGDSMFIGTPFEGYRNLAIIPGTNLPVSINTVNSGQPGTGSPANCTFTPQGISQFVRNHIPDDPYYNLIKLNGLTKLMEARTKVISCESYRMILVVSDVQDRSYDSNVFLERGSLQSGEYFKANLLTTAQLDDTITACQPGRIVFQRCQANSGERWVIPFLTSGSAQPDTDFLRRLPNGSLVPLSDSIVLEAGMVEDSLVLQAVGSQFTTKDLTIRFLDVQRPYLTGGQPNYIGQPIRMQFRPLPTVPVNPLTFCAYDSAQIRFQGPDLPGMQYRWREWTSGQETDPLFMDCDTCRTPHLFSDSASRLYRVTISNSYCSYSDSLRIVPKPFVLPVFEQGPGWFLLSNPQAQYQYQWTINQQISTASPTDTLWYNSGDQIQFSAQSPNGCASVFDSTALFTSVIPGVNSLESQMQVFPNPTTEWIEVSGIKEPTEIQMVSVNGQVYSQGTFQRGKARFSTKALPDGLYWIELQSLKTLFTQRKKLVKVSR